MAATGYASARWKSLRRKVLARDSYTCQMCGAMLRQGRSDDSLSILRPAVADHIIPHRGDHRLFYDIANLWALCCDCHDGPCQMIEDRRGLKPEQVRAAKLSHRVPSIDGTNQRPLIRWVDTAYPQARLMIW